MNSEHTIVLLQFEQEPKTRSYLHYQTQREAIESFIQMFEENYRKSAIETSAEYDIQELYDFIDNFADLLFLEFSQEKKIYQPRSKDWAKVQCFNYLKSQTG